MESPLRSSTTQYCDGKRHKLVFEAKPSQSHGDADWREIDKLYIEIADKALIITSDGLCRIHGKEDPELFAMVRPDDVQHWRAIKSMKKTAKPKKMTLSRETLRLLNDPKSLSEVKGGMPITVGPDTYSGSSYEPWGRAGRTGCR